jgi:hypothetical protein
MRALLDELTQDVVEQVNLRNIHNMERFTQSGNAHYDNMAKQLNALNEIMNKLVGQMCQPVTPIANHFQPKTIVGYNSPHNSPGLNLNQGLEPPFGPSTSNQRGNVTPNLNGGNEITNWGYSKYKRQCPE